ncbi:MAG: PAP2 family protein [Chlorobi bacterium CHB7]|nr:PAP2 family protein [Chlorobi bacterium CHB7]OQY78725.1 MAG: hypothetical protein B6D43_01735 [Ignavibacteriales bacterium UTCHB1]
MLKKFFRYNRDLIIISLCSVTALCFITMFAPVSFSSFREPDLFSDMWYFITITGNYAMLIVILCLFLIFSCFLYFKKFGKMKGYIIFNLIFATSFTLLGLSNEFVLKEIFKGIRPSQIYLQQFSEIHETDTNLPDVNKSILNEWLNARSYSFPSGHAVASFYLAITFAFILKKLISSGFSFIMYLPFIWAFLVSISRVVIGIHNNFDVIIGAFIGVFASFIFLYYSNATSVFNPSVATLEAIHKS